MGIQDTAWHLACLKAQLEKVKSADESGTCFLAFSRAAILHIAPGAEPSRLKSPRVICPRLQNAWKLQSEQYEPLFEDPEPLRITRDIAALCIHAAPRPAARVVSPLPPRWASLWRSSGRWM